MWRSMAEWLPRLVACIDQASMSVLSNKMGDGDQTGDKACWFFSGQMLCP